MAPMSKSASEYLRRKSVKLTRRNVRESAAIRYQNQNVPISKQAEDPPMTDWITITDNIRQGNEHN